MAEDFLPFSVNVTTELPTDGWLVKTQPADREWGIRAIFGDPTNWTPRAAGGADSDSFISSFEDPVWIQVSGNDMAAFGSHEVGHALGLDHDSQGANGYYEGHGSDETSWGPLMNGAVYGQISQWSQGSYPGATNLQDDLSIITTQNGFGYRPDDHGDSLLNATSLIRLGGDSRFLFQEGVIERNTDADWFRFTVGIGNFEITVDPLATMGNLDVRADLFDAAGELIATSDRVNDVAASLTASLAAGTYFLKVDGVGNPDPTSPGYDDYASLGFYAVEVGAAATTLTFQEGVDGYAGTADTTISRDFASTSKAKTTPLYVDGRYSSNPAASLIRFNDIFGNGVGQIPAGALVQSATLDLNFVDSGDSFTVHHVLRDWSEADTYTSLVDGMAADGVDAAAEAIAVSADYVNGWSSLNITAAVNAWLADRSSNYGLLVQPGAGSTNGNDIASAESAMPPKLTVVFLPPPITEDYVIDAPSGVPTTLPELPAGGSGTVVKRGAGVLILDRANTHTGGTLVEAGEAVIRYVAALGTGGLEIRANAKATFDVAGGVVPVASLTVAAGGAPRVRRGPPVDRPGRLFTRGRPGPAPQRPGGRLARYRRLHDPFRRRGRRRRPRLRRQRRR